MISTVVNLVYIYMLQLNPELRCYGTEEVMGQRPVGPYSTQGECYCLRLKKAKRHNNLAEAILLLQQQDMRPVVGRL